MIDPLNRLRDAVRADDDAGLRACAEDVAGQRAAISWACDQQRPSQIRELGAAMTWLAVSLDDADGQTGVADLSA